MNKQHLNARWIILHGILVVWVLVLLCGLNPVVWGAARTAETPVLSQETPGLVPPGTFPGGQSLDSPKDIRSQAITLAADSAWNPYLIGIIGGFHQAYPHIKVIRQPTSSKGLGLEIDSFLKDMSKVRRGNGYTKGPFGSNSIKMVALSRPLTHEEQEASISRFGYPPTSLVIGKEAVALFVNRANPVRSVSLKQIQTMFSRSSILSNESMSMEWGNLGAQGHWADFPVELVGLKSSQERGSHSLFRQLVLQGKEWNGGMKEAPGPASLMLSVANNPFGMAFGPLGFSIPQIRVLPVSRKSGLPAIAPSTRTVVNGTYPLSRPLYLHVNKIPNTNLSPALAQFLSFLLSSKGQTLLASAGIFPLEKFEITRNLQVLQMPLDFLSARPGQGRTASEVFYR